MQRPSVNTDLKIPKDTSLLVSRLLNTLCRSTREESSIDFSFIVHKIKYNLGRILADRGKLQEALKVYHDAVRTLPDHVEPHSLYNMIGRSSSWTLQEIWSLFLSSLLQSSLFLSSLLSSPSPLLSHSLLCSALLCSTLLCFALLSSALCDNAFVYIIIRRGL